jgi:hypothetical protein
VSWIDKAKVALGILSPEDIEEDDAEPRAQRRSRPDRPPLNDSMGAPQQSLQDAFEAREAGDNARMRQLLREMDRGGGLRTAIRAAAALEAGDENELQPLLVTLAQDPAPWRLQLQTAAALGGNDQAEELRQRAVAQKAPVWALAWCRIDPKDEEAFRHGLVDLLFCDPALARTVAARDLEIEGAVADTAAAARYAGFAHGRDCIARFGAEQVAKILNRSRSEDS